MQHTIPVDQLGVHGSSMARVVEACVHCGFCLPTCPTYVILGEEMDSPRGRIVLMKSALEGRVTEDQVLPFIDRCLGCMACVSACPSGVQYGELLMPFRAMSESSRTRPLVDRLTRALVRESLPYPERFRLAARAGGLAAPFQGLLPEAWGAMLTLLPDELVPARPLPEIYPAEGPRRARVALLAGCVQQVMFPDINWASLRVLARNGVEVVVPKGQGCCGALMSHTGDFATARGLARQNLQALTGDFDAILTNAAGCGSGMKDYGRLFEGEPESAAAAAFVEKVQDISEFLDALGLRPPDGPGRPIKVAYHDACHLAHAQGIQSAPRRLLRQIPGLTLVDLPENDLCCGSAGTYNIEQPQIAERLGARKAANIQRAGAEAVVMGNVGCMVQIARHLKQAGQGLAVMHTIECLDLAYQAV